MGRKLRRFAIGVPYHIAHRGNHKQNLFESDEDRLYYLSLLHRCSRMTGTRIAGFCLMSNHIHAIAIPSSLAGLSICFGAAHRRYSIFLNDRHGLRGSNWEGRFYSDAMDRHHAVNALRYIERNPVEAGLVRKAWDWRWSSAAHHCGLQAQWPLLTVDIRGQVDPFAWRDSLGSPMAEEDLMGIRWAALSVASDTTYCGVGDWGGTTAVPGT
jgi:putative transposase